MLSRSGSTTSNNPQRTKSTTSVKERRKYPLQVESIDPQTARTHALIAAHRAVDRSRALTSSEHSRTESLVSGRHTTTGGNQSLHSSPATYLRRQRSTLQIRVPKLADTLNVPGAQSSRKNPPCFVEFGMPGENYGAEPSSYRRLMRTQSSLASPQRHSLRSEPSETSFSQAKTLRTTASSVALHSPGLKLRLKRSLKFLRSAHSANTRIITAPGQLQTANACSPEAIDLAKTLFSQDVSKPVQSQSVTSAVFSRTKQVHRTFRKTCRTANSPKAVTSLDGQSGISTSDAHQGRSLSTSIGVKMKKLFTKSRNDEVLPPQQMEASRAHFSLDLSSPHADAGFDSYLETASTSQYPDNLYVLPEAYPTSKGNTAQLLQHLNQSSSCETLTSTTKSRVTSWTNSTATDSIAARPSTYEPKRLSIIKEDGGPHQPSSSVGRHIGGVSIFQKPLNIPEGQAVDSHRVYSALVKRIDEEQKEMERTQAALKEIHDAQTQDDVVGHYLFAAPTIRRVQSKGSSSLIAIRENSSDHSEQVGFGTKAAISSSCNQLQPSAELHEWKSKQQRIESDLHPLTERDKLGSASPFRHIPVGSNSLLNRQVANQPDLRSDSFAAQQMTRIGGFGNSKYNQSTESVYSRTTNGGTNVDYTSPMSSTDEFRPIAHRTNGMDALLYSSVQQTSKSERPPSRGQLGISTTSPDMGAWQGWMEHQMQGLEKRRTSSVSANHVREHAQIDPDDTDIGSSSQKMVFQHTKFIPTRSRTYIVPNTSTRSSPVVGALPNRKLPASPLQLREVPRNYTPIPSKSTMTKKSQSALFNEAKSAHDMRSNDHKVSGLRKISPANVAKMLKSRKSQPVLSAKNGPGKENTPVNAISPTPVSTPGRYQVQGRDVYSTDRLRKGKSAFCLGRDPTAPLVTETRISLDNSPPDRVKGMFSARLSKPFDMDVPGQNRPFDSIYLGRREAGIGTANRLSVAPTSNTLRSRKTYGDLEQSSHLGADGAGSSHDSEDFGTTALPILPATNVIRRSASGLSISLAGRRIISGILRGKEKHDSIDDGTSPSRSPAFI